MYVRIVERMLGSLWDIWILGAFDLCRVLLRQLSSLNPPARTYIYNIYGSWLLPIKPRARVQVTIETEIWFNLFLYFTILSGRNSQGPRINGYYCKTCITKLCAIKEVAFVKRSSFYPCKLNYLGSNPHYKTVRCVTWSIHPYNNSCIDSGHCYNNCSEIVWIVGI